VHVYGEARADLKAWSSQHQIPLHTFAWQHEHDKAGLCRDAAYLLRPDTYVALADPQASTATLSQYFSDRGLTLPV
jgi:hypothetical protein